MTPPTGQLELFSLDSSEVGVVPEYPTLHPAIRDMLFQRGIHSHEDIERYLKPNYERDIHDPFLFDDMATCVSRIMHAIESREKICIYGDYDVDGISATVILYETLAKLGGDVVVRINHRDDDGYGLQINAIDAIESEGVSLIITTDQGISNKRETDYAQTKGIDVIITDHHTVPDDPTNIPFVVGIIHPRVHAENYPFKDLSGGGAAFKLAQGLIQSQHPLSREWRQHEKWLLDLVCISTLADCVPLLGENRAFLHFGLIVLNKTQRIGLQTLLNKVPIRTQTITPHTISFYISPLLNAASRMDHALRSFNLLIAKDSDAAEEIVDTLAGYNKERQKLTTRITREASAQCKMQPDATRILVGSSDTWPIGVLGLVAGTLVRTLNKPVVLISEKPGKNVGVARSTFDIHITHSFQKIDILFDRYGGHHRAGGFALKEGVLISEFIERINGIDYDSCAIPDNGQEHTQPYDIPLTDITLEFAEQIARCKPWGQGNHQPSFRIDDCMVTSISCVGKKQQHLRLGVEKDGHRQTMIGIKKAKSSTDISRGDVVCIHCHVDTGYWNGARDIFIELIDYVKKTV